MILFLLNLALRIARSFAFQFWAAVFFSCLGALCINNGHVLAGVVFAILSGVFSVPVLTKGTK